MEIPALLTKARADTEIALGDLQSGFDIYKTILETLPEVASECLLRLSFLLGHKTSEEDYLAGLGAHRRNFWEAVFEVRRGNYRETLEFEAESTSDLAYLGLLYPPAQQESAVDVWMHYLETVESGWERAFVAEELLRRKPSMCQMCQEAQAGGFMRDQPVCSGCLQLLQDPNWFKETMKGEDPAAIELLENLSGEAFEGPVDMDDLFPQPVRERALPLVKRLEKLEKFYPLFENALKQCWDQAVDMAEGPLCDLKPRHLWSALHHPGDSLSKAIHKDTIEADRELYDQGDGDADLLRILNIARWWDTLNPNSKSSEISIGTVYRSLAYCFDETRPTMFTPLIRMIGMGCNARQAAEFESLLEKSPDDIFLRIVLANYSSMESFSKVNPHDLWLVNHHPHLADSTSGSLWLGSPVEFRIMLQAWSEAVEQHSDDPRVLDKAGNFFRLSQPWLSLRLSQRAATLKPEETTYRMSVGHAMESLAREALNPEARTRLLMEAVAWCEEALDRYEDPDLRSMFLVDAVSYAFRARDYFSVERFAKELLQQAASVQGWNAGNSLHCAHLALGHLALNKEQLDEAKKHLLAAADIEGSPQLKSFGPHFGLARRFLALGEREVVTEYLRLCREFWFSGQGLIDAWLGELKAGRIPELGGFRGE